MATHIEIRNQAITITRWIVTVTLFIIFVILTNYLSSANNLHSLFQRLSMLPEDLSTALSSQIIANVIYLVLLIIFGLTTAVLVSALKIPAISSLTSKFFVYLFSVSLFTSIAYIHIQIERNALYFEPLWNIVSFIEFLALILTLIHIVYSEHSSRNILSIIAIFVLMYMCTFGLYINIFNIALTTASPLSETGTEPLVALRYLSHSALAILATWETNVELTSLSSISEEMRRSLQSLILLLSIVSRFIFALVLGKFIHFLYRAGAANPTTRHS